MRHLTTSLLIAGALMLGAPMTAAASPADSPAPSSDPAPADVARPAECSGPAALGPGCTNVPAADPPYSPSAREVAAAGADPRFAGCHGPGIAGSAVTRCEIGDVSDPVHTIALVGDSHAAAWLPGVDRMARERHWRVVVYTKSSCPLTSAYRVLDTEGDDAARFGCREWGAAVTARIVADDSIDAVLTTSYSSAYTWASPPGKGWEDPGVDGFRDAWSAFLDAGRPVVVIPSVPRTIGTSVPNCLTGAADPLECAVDRATALPEDPVVLAATEADVEFADLTDRFCDEERCLPAVGGIIVYRDYSHLAPAYAEALAPYLGDHVQAVLDGPGDPAAADSVNGVVVAGVIGLVAAVGVVLAVIVSVLTSLRRVRRQRP